MPPRPGEGDGAGAWPSSATKGGAHLRHEPRRRGQHAARAPPPPPRKEAANVLRRPREKVQEHLAVALRFVVAAVASKLWPEGRGRGVVLRAGIALAQPTGQSQLPS